MLNKTNMNNNNDTGTYSLIQDLETVKKQEEALREQIKILEAQVQKNLARGTKVGMNPLTAADTLSTRIERFLQNGPATSSVLAKELNEQLPAIRAEMRLLRNAKKITNAGTEAAPRWNLKLDEKKVSTKDIQTNVLRLITGTPLSFAELVIATGIRGGLVQGALVEIRRSGIEIHNFGTKARARYFVMPPNYLDARLAPKPVKTPSHGVPLVQKVESE